MNNLKLEKWNEYLEIDKCENDIKYFIESYCKITTPFTFGNISFKLNEYQTKLVESYSLYDYIKIYPDRQIGNTTVLLCIAIHNLIFGVDSKIMYTSVNHRMSENSCRIFNDIYHQLPEMFFRKLKYNNRHEISTVDNNIIKFVSVTPLKCLVSANLVLMDNANYYNDSNLFEYTKIFNINSKTIITN